MEFITNDVVDLLGSSPDGAEVETPQLRLNLLMLSTYHHIDCVIRRRSVNQEDVRGYGGNIG